MNALDLESGSERVAPALLEPDRHGQPVAERAPQAQLDLGGRMVKPEGAEREQSEEQSSVRQGA